MSRVDQIIDHEAEHVAYLDSLGIHPSDSGIVLMKDVMAIQGIPTKYVRDDAHEQTCCGCPNCSRYRELNGIERRSLSDLAPPW